MATKKKKAKTYSAKQYKALLKKLNTVTEQLNQATSSTAVMQNNLDNAYAEVNRYRNMQMDLQDKYLDVQESSMENAAKAQKEANEFNSAEAEKQRVWSESMSATAHQREVADLQAAGLNPVISAYGSGASVGSGAAASSSNQLTSAYAAMAQSALGAISSMASAMDSNATSYAKTVMDASISARGQDINYLVNTYAADLASKTNLSMNQATNEMNKYIAKMNNLNNAEIARIAANANVSSAQIHAAATQYASDIAYASAIKTASMNNQTSKEIAEMQVNKTFEGMGTSVLQKAGKAITDYLTGQGAYAKK